MEKCPGCGEPMTELDRINTFFKCGSLIASDMEPNLQRSSKCYEAQLTQAQVRIEELEALVREMTPFVQGFWCGEDQTFWPDKNRAAEILNRDEVKAIMEEKP